MANHNISNCGKCEKVVDLAEKKAIICDGDCKFSFHKACCGLTSRKFEEILKDSEKFWFCVPCKAKREKRRSTMTAQTLGAASFSNASTPLSVVARSSRNSNKDDSSSEIIEKLNKSLSIQEKIQKDIADLKVQLDDYRKIVDQLTDENTELRNENDKLNVRIDLLEYKMETRNQQQINKNLLISGICTNDNENLVDIVTDIATTVKAVCNKDDIKKLYRSNETASNSGMPPQIVVEFFEKSVRDELLAKKKGHNLNTGALASYSGDARPIYIGEMLTGYRQFVFKRARDLKRENIVKYAWVKDGEVFVRKDDTSRIIKIKHHSQIDVFIR